MDEPVVDTAPVQDGPPSKLSVAAFAAQIKAKYPQYKDVDDAKLASTIVQKYPTYANKVDFNSKPQPAPQVQSAQPSSNPFALQSPTQPYQYVTTNEQARQQVQQNNPVTPGFREFNPSQYKGMPSQNPADVQNQSVVPQVSNTNTAPRSSRLLTPAEQASFDAPVALNRIDNTKANAQEEADMVARNKELADQRAQEEKDRPGSWGNTFPTLMHAVFKMGSDLVQGGANLERNLVGSVQGGAADKDLYQDTPIYNKHGSLIDTKRELSPYGKQVDAGIAHDPLGSFIIGLDAYRSETDKVDAQNKLPDTFLGNTASGAIHIAPDLVTMALLPESAETEVGDMLSVLTKAAKNPFTKLQAAKGAITGYNKDGVEGAVEGGLEGAGSGMQMSLLGDFAGGVVSPKIAKGLESIGLAKSGKLTATGADMLADATVFGAQPIASNLIQGKPIDWSEVQSGVGTGLGFGMVKALKTYREHSDVENKVKDVLKNAQGIALQNFADAAPQAAVEAYKSPDSSADLMAKATEAAHGTMTESDIDKKKELAATSSLYAKTAGVKSVIEAIVNDKESFVKSIEKSELPEEQKAALIEKANYVEKHFDPVEQQKRDLANQIKALEAKETDNVIDEKEKSVKLKALNKQLDEIVTNQYDQKQDRLSGKTVTYSKGTGEDEGKFFKTKDGKREEITQSRYELEKPAPSNQTPAETPTSEETPVTPVEETPAPEETPPAEANIPNSEAPTLKDVTRNLDETGKPGMAIEEGKTGGGTPELPREQAPVEGYKYITNRDADGKVNGAIEVSYYADDGSGLKDTPQSVKVVVDENSRRQGIATALFKHAEENGIDLKDVRGKNMTADGKALYEASQKPLSDIFNIDGKDKFYHASSTERVGRLREGDAPQFGKGVYFSTEKDLVSDEFGHHITEVRLKLKNPLYTGTKEEDEVLNLAAKNWNRDNMTYDKEDEVWRDKQGRERDLVTGSDLGERLPARYFSDAAKELGYDAIIDKDSHTYGNEVVVLDESKIHYPEDDIKSKEDAIQKQEPGKMGVRDEAAVGEGVGGQDGSKESPPDSGSESSQPEEKTVSSKKASNNAQAEKVGVELKDNKGGVRSKDIVEAEADKALADGYDVHDLVDKIKNEKHVATDTENAILAKHIGARTREITDLNERIAKEGATLSEKALDDLVAQREKALQDFEEVANANDQTRSDAGRALNSGKFKLQDNYSLENMILNERKLKGDKLTPEELAKVNEQHQVLEEANKVYEEKLKAAQDEIARLKAEKATRKAAASKPRAKTHADFVSERKQIAEDFSKALKKMRGQANDVAGATLDFLRAAAPYATKMVASYAREGITELGEVVKRLKDDLDLNDLPDRDVHDLISGKYNTPERKTDLQTKIRTLKNEAKLLAEIDDAEKGLRKLPEAKQKTQNARIKELQDRLRELDKENGLYDEKNAQESANRLKKDIADLQGRIDRGEFDKEPSAPVAEETPEVRELRRQRDALRHEYDVERAKRELEKRSKIEKAKDNLLNFLSLPRAIKATLDFSAVGRQGLFLSPHSKQAKEALKTMFGQTFSEKKYQDWFSDLKNSPQYDLIKNSGLYISEKNNPELLAREEQFTSNLLEKAPVIGKIHQGAERAYTGYLNAIRTGVFLSEAAKLQERGYTWKNNPKEFQDLATVINVLSGRGNIPGWLGGQQPAFLSNIMFSPRFVAARIHTLYLFADPRLSRNARTLAAKDIGKVLGSAAVLLSMASLAGYKVSHDPRSSDFLKLRDGDTRYDLLGGTAQYIVYLAQQLTGKKVPAGKTYPNDLSKPKTPMSPTRASVTENFIRGKLSPILGIGWNLQAGKDVTGQPYHLSNVPQEFIPLPATDLYDAYKVGGIENALKVLIPSQFGVGVSSYKTKSK
jgi:GNAT superfamily N-acetyltransferase